MKLPNPIADFSRLEPLHFVVNLLYFWLKLKRRKNIYLKKWQTIVRPLLIGSPWHPEHFGLKFWRQDDTARDIIISARFACVTGALKHQHGILRGDVGTS